MRVRIRNSAGQVVGYQAPMPRPEPVLNGLLEKVEYTTHQDRSGQYQKPLFHREKVEWLVDPALVLQDYRRARMPQATKEAVKPLQLSLAEIDRLLLLCEK